MKFITNIYQWFFSKAVSPYWCVLVLDCLIVFFGVCLGEFFELGSFEYAMSRSLVFKCGLFCLVPYVIAFGFFHTYRIAVRYTSFTDLYRVLLANVASCTVLAILKLHFDNFTWTILPGRVTLITMLGVIVLLMCVVRVAVRLTYVRFKEVSGKNKAYVYGIRSGALSIANRIIEQPNSDYSICGFVCPPGEAYVKFLLGKQVYKDAPGLISRMVSEGVKYMLVSPIQIDNFRDSKNLVADLTAAGIRILVMPEIEEWDGKSDLNSTHFREIEVEELLPRDQIEIDLEAIGRMLQGRRVLVTGAAGSIGSELSRQIAKFAPSDLVLVDQAETPMHDVRRHMAAQHPELSIHTIVTSITDSAHMERIFAEHRPEFVFHAAAYKHVPMMEDNPSQAVRNNICGTRIIADLAVKYGVRKFVMISTDKAVNPTNVMGCSKRICEIYCQSLNASQDTTQFITTRFGNVLGSNGSVIPIFREQILKGGPVKVTHPEIIRYFMLIPEACRLVLEAGTMGKGGEIFVFDMGRPVKIADLAKLMIDLSGAKNVKIEYTGLRAGEKLYEELLAANETNKPTDNPKIMKAQVREFPYEMALRNEEELYELSKSFDNLAIVRKMKEIVPEYESTNPEYAM